MNTPAVRWLGKGHIQDPARRRDGRQPAGRARLNRVREMRRLDGIRRDGRGRHAVRTSGAVRIADGCEPLVRRELLEAVRAVIEPDAEAQIGIGEKGGRHCRHVVREVSPSLTA